MVNFSILQKCFLNTSIIVKVYTALCNSILFMIKHVGEAQIEHTWLQHILLKTIILYNQRSYLSEQIRCLGTHKLYIKQIIVKSIQRHILNDIGILDRRKGKYTRPPYNISLTSSRSSPITREKQYQSSNLENQT